MARKLKTTVAYCYRSGLIEFGPTTPAGAIPIYTGEDKKLREKVEVLARHGQGKSAGKLLVPGVPEASNDMNALAAVEQFVAGIKLRMEK